MTPDKKKIKETQDWIEQAKRKCAENAAEIAKLQAEIAQLSGRIKKLEHENRNFDVSIPHEEEHLRELLKKGAAAL